MKHLYEISQVERNQLICQLFGLCVDVGATEYDEILDTLFDLTRLSDYDELDIQTLAGIISNHWVRQDTDPMTPEVERHVYSVLEEYLSPALSRQITDELVQKRLI